MIPHVIVSILLAVSECASIKTSAVGRARHQPKSLLANSLITEEQTQIDPASLICSPIRRDASQGGLPQMLEPFPVGRRGDLGIPFKYIFIVELKLIKAFVCDMPVCSNSCHFTRLHLVRCSHTAATFLRYLMVPVNFI